jgi:hypothetical protein
VRGQFLWGFQRESPARAVFSHTYKIPVLPRGSGELPARLAGISGLPARGFPTVWEKGVGSGGIKRGKVPQQVPQLPRIGCSQ